MYSIASWSPSQSEPLIVSYMCQSQLSSDMLPSDAPMPPCAATVCERVGNTFDSTATLKPASASCSDARMPAPPAPTINASKRRVCSFIGSPCARRRSWSTPQHLHRPPAIGDEHADDDDLQRQPDAHRLRVVHQDVAHAHPRMPQERDHEDECRDAKRVAGEQALPRRMVEPAVPEQDAEQQRRVDEHDDRRDALRQPVAQAVVRADRKRTRARHHSRTAMTMSNSTDTTSSTAAELRAGASWMPACRSSALSLIHISEPTRLLS